MPPLCDTSATLLATIASVTSALLADSTIPSVTLTRPIVLGPSSRIEPAARLSFSCRALPSGPLSPKPLASTIAAGVPRAASAHTASITRSAPSSTSATSGASGSAAMSA